VTSVEQFSAILRTAGSVIIIIIIIITTTTTINEYYYGGAVALQLQDHLTMSLSRFAD